MDTESTDANLLLLSLNLSDSEPEEAAAPDSKTASSQGATTECQPTRAERTALSEEAFQHLKQTYRPKVENGNIYKTTPLPLSSPPTPLSKPALQSLLHAAEELYFFRRYDEAVAFLRQVLDDADDKPEGKDGKPDRKGKANRKGGIDGETRRLLGYYLERCLTRLREEGGDAGGEAGR